MRKFLIVSLFLTGLISFTLFALWVIAAFLFIFGEGDYAGAIAFVPKEVFFLAPLIFLGKKKEVIEFLDYLVADGD